MTVLHGGRVDKLEIYPNLWAGVGLVRGGAWFAEGVLPLLKQKGVA